MSSKSRRRTVCPSRPTAADRRTGLLPVPVPASNLEAPMLLLRNRTAVPPRRGVVLIAVLIVVVLLTLAAYQYSELMMAEYQASVSFTRATQARAYAQSGVNYAALLLSDPNLFTSRLNNNPYDNAEYFRAVKVGEASRGGRQGYFSV